jgi:predicted GH43/DUF377 family glycosyl hydrolase
LFHPSIRPHPDQAGLPPGALRFILSLRATGEGHISSITFRTGVLHGDRRIKVLAALGEVWLALSHGVGPMRKYCIGAFLLDRDDPSKVIGRLREPLLLPNAAEREGYVPNVVYTCGALTHNGDLVISYGLAGHATGFATVKLGELLAALRPDGCAAA